MLIGLCFLCLMNTIIATNTENTFLKTIMLIASDVYIIVTQVLKAQVMPSAGEQIP